MLLIHSEVMQWMVFHTVTKTLQRVTEFIDGHHNKANQMLAEMISISQHNYVVFSSFIVQIKTESHTKVDLLNVIKYGTNISKH
jgi:hypothetical protein